MLTGDPHRTEHVAGQLRLQRQDLVATDLADVIDTVAVGLLDDGRRARSSSLHAATRAPVSSSGRLRRAWMSRYSR